MYLFMKVSLSPYIILCGWLGLKHQLTDLTNPDVTRCCLLGTKNHLLLILDLLWVLGMIYQSKTNHSSSIFSHLKLFLDQMQCTL